MGENLYLIPLSVFYAIALLFGLLGKKHLDASVVSPLENIDGAMAAIVLYLFFLLSGRSHITDSIGMMDLIGTVVIGVGLPYPTAEREACREYYDERCDAGKEYAYLYPGMNRVLQAAGRVIRDERDVGTVVLIDDRFATPTYRPLLPPHWRSLTFVGNNRSLAEFLRRFWCRHSEEEV